VDHDEDKSGNEDVVDCLEMWHFQQFCQWGWTRSKHFLGQVPSYTCFPEHRKRQKKHKHTDLTDIKTLVLSQLCTSWSVSSGKDGEASMRKKEDKK
jgi:hypothetical protein